MSNKKKPRSRGGDLSQFGLFDIPTDLSVNPLNGGDDDEANDSDLEAELLALAGSGPKPPRRKQPPANMNVDLDAMVQESMKDIPSDEELSGDDDDPELLGELNELTGEEREIPETESEPTVKSSSPTDMVKLLEERMQMYELAEKNAKASGESSRARRFNRGLKTLKDQLKQAKAGRPVKDDDIPPEVFTGSTQKAPEGDGVASPTRTAPPPPVAQTSPVEVEKPTTTTPAEPVDNSALLELLNQRRNEYKIAAVAAKKSGDKDAAVNYLKIFKQFEMVIKAAESGQPVDISNMPGAPAPIDVAPTEVETQNNPPEGSDVPGGAEIPLGDSDVPEEQLITAGSVAEALLQRLEVYQKQEEAAKEQGNSSKSRRMGRIVKQYQQAIKQNSAGKPVPFDELPTPPGYAPIPTSPEAAKAAQPESKPEPEPSTASNSSPETEKREAPKKPAPQRQNTIRISGNHVANSRSEKQIALLLAKQKEFKVAALKAKQNGEIEQAKEYLRNAKRLEPLIDAASSGLPVDMNSLPISPTAKVHFDAEYDVVMADECTEESTADMDLIGRLEAQLTKQLKMCLSTRDHHKALGDVAGTNRFERLALSVTKDLDYVRLVQRTTGAAIPKFHFEMKDFSIVKSFTELGDNDLELTILRGINYNCPNPAEVDTYVKCEFPFPQEEPWRERTAPIKNTNNPEYDVTYVIPIQRTARACGRVFKRHGIKFEIYARGGFFRSDPLLGTATVKLQPLETQCELHDSFDVMDGRKKTGGKLEVRLRLRQPILSQQVEKLEEKWLVIDHH